MKKIFSFIFATTLAVQALAYDINFQSGDLFYNIKDYNMNNDYKVEVSYQHYSSDHYLDLTTVDIPEKVTYNGVEYSVTSIGREAFNNCRGLTSVTIPNSVTSIGSNAA